MDSIHPDVLNINFGEQLIELQILEKLGSGAFATVWKAIDARGAEFAVKKVKCLDAENHHSVSQEISVLLRIQHPHIIKLFALDYVDASYSAVLVMEFCENGTLNSLLDKPDFDSASEMEWMCQLSSALEHLHNHNIVHRDLKPDNILVTGNRELKIADFGVARSFVSLRGGGMFNENSGEYISEYLSACMGTFAGTPYWVAPEVFEHAYDEKADIFSLGVIFYAIREKRYCMHQGKKFFGCFVEYGNQDVGIGVKMYETGRAIVPYIANPHKLAAVVNLYCKMLSFNPLDRPTAQGVTLNLNHIHYSQLTRCGSKECLDSDESIDLFACPGCAIS